MNILSVDNDAKTLLANFAGAFSGMYQISIRHSTYGLLDTEGMFLDVSSKVLSVSPSTGSIYGGTLVTITGTNYGSAITDNPVEISTNGGIGNVRCYVKEIVNHDTITCRIDENMTPLTSIPEEATLIVFLKTYEEAQCESSVCAWTYTDVLPEITAMTTEFDTDSMTWLVKFEGTALRDSAEAGEMADFQINGVSQPVKTHSDTMAVFTVTDATDLTSTDLNLFFPVGLPKGHDLVRAGFTLEPRFVSMTPNEGTPGSTLIQANVQGVGTSTTGLDLVRGDDDATICRTDLEVVSYGLVQCWSKRNFDYLEPV